MKFIIVENYDELSRLAGEMIVTKVKNSPNIILGLATGGTPEGTYKFMIEDHKHNGTTYQNVTTFNLDEYIGLSGDHPNSYRRFMDEHLLNHIDIRKERTFIPCGDADDLEKECERYEKLIAEAGGIDLQLLGIGRNGHIGFNEPGTSFQSKTHIVDLTESTRQANSIYFDRIEDVPTKAITMGIDTIMNSREILLLVSGDSKKETLKQLIEGEIDESFPASILKKHPKFTLIADKAAASLLSKEAYPQGTVTY